jgi:hypothetical protein
VALVVAIDGDNVERTLWADLKSQLNPAALMQLLHGLWPMAEVRATSCHSLPQKVSAMIRHETYLSRFEAAGIKVRRWRRGRVNGQTVCYPDSWVMGHVREQLAPDDDLVLVTADRDYCPLIQEAHDQGRRVMVISPQPTRRWPAGAKIYELDWLDVKHPGLLTPLEQRPVWIPRYV